MNQASVAWGISAPVRRFLLLSLGLLGLAACESPERRFASLLGDAGTAVWSARGEDAGGDSSSGTDSGVSSGSHGAADSGTETPLTTAPPNEMPSGVTDPSASGSESNESTASASETETSEGITSASGVDTNASTSPAMSTTGSAEPACGDGALQDGEGCDDGGFELGDGCDAACQVEPGWTCDGEGADACQLDCGNGVVEEGEACDDGNARDGDGCGASCEIEPGFTCDDGEACAAVCGDGRLVAAEAEAGGCDDGNTRNGDGCASDCQTEAGWSCAGEPSSCQQTCGDGELQGSESCDDGNAVSGDGCDGCQVESGWSCSGEPSACSTRCGDGKTRGDEACDDGNSEPGDGCSPSCAVEAGWTCEGQPSTCRAQCGDGLKRGNEGCDDGNTLSRDGCSSSCRAEDGWTCTGANPTVCTDIDECSAAQVCGPGKWICSNQPGSHSCECGGDHAVYGTYCGCRPQSATNLVGNGGFDSGMWGPWKPYGPTSSSQRLDPEDADACGDSGCAFVEFDAGNRGLFYQCIDVEPDTEYSFGYRYLRSAHIGVGCEWVFYTGTCASRGEFITLGNLSTAVAASDDPGWRSASGKLITPPGAGNLDLSCGAVSKGTNDRTSARMDQFYLNAQGNQF